MAMPQICAMICVVRRAVCWCAAPAAVPAWIWMRAPVTVPSLIRQPVRQGAAFLPPSQRCAGDCRRRGRRPRR
jgi:hypothetical protein